MAKLVEDNIQGNEVVMNVQQLISFFGHTSDSVVLMDFLIDHGIKKTPKGDCVTRVRSVDKKISLEFDLTETYLKENPRQPVGSGRFTFSSVDIYPGAEVGLPFGLSFDLPKAEVDELLGKSFDNAEKQVQKYYKDGCLIIVFFNEKRTGVDIFRFKNPNIYNIESMNLGR